VKSIATMAQSGLKCGSTPPLNRFFLEQPLLKVARKWRIPAIIPGARQSAAPITLRRTAIGQNNLDYLHVYRQPQYDD
jgi:hypothetical protein